MEVQQLADYEEQFQFAVGEILRDLAILMMFAEHHESCDEMTYTSTLNHLQALKHLIDQLVQLMEKEESG